MGDDIYELYDLQKLSEHEFALLVSDEGEEGLQKKGQIIEENTPDQFFNNPESDRLKLFLEQILSH